MKYLVIFVVFVAFITLTQLGCGNAASERQAEQALQTQGFSNIQFQKRHIFFVTFIGCGREDTARFDFTATNPAGKQVKVYVCEGWPFKGATVRYP